MSKKALIAMSGGVDSSIAAAIMHDRGYDCMGATMRLFQGAPADAAGDAEKTAGAIGIPFRLLQYEQEFEERIITPFIQSYERGETPNPCVICNRKMKFDKLWEAAREMGFDVIATGHYARIQKDDASGRYLLKKALDSKKDQSYMLYALSQEQLAHAVFPLGETTKEDVRKLAKEKGFVAADKQDSQDICFIPDGDYARFIAERTGKEYPPGDFVDPEGNVLGRHKGIIHYTIGQRKGLGIASTAPLYVTQIDPEANTVTLSHGDGLFARHLLARDINLISTEKIEGTIRASARIRYHHQEQPAQIRQDGDQLDILFDQPQRAITKGQAVVIYDGDTVIGGGTICEILPDTIREESC